MNRCVCGKTIHPTEERARHQAYMDTLRSPFLEDRYIYQCRTGAWHVTKQPQSRRAALVQSRQRQGGSPWAATSH